MSVVGFPGLALIHHDTDPGIRLVPTVINIDAVESGTANIEIPQGDVLGAVDAAASMAS